MIEFLIEVNKQIYDIGELVTSISYSDILNDGCSKLEFSYLADNIIITNGSVIRFKYNSASIFYGYVFKIGRDKTKEIKVTAYDQLRYLKAKDTIVVKETTLGALIKRGCTYFGLKAGNIADTKHKLPTSVQDDKTWLDIFYDAETDTLLGSGKKYSIRDEFGSIALRNLEDLKLNLILGDESLCYDFDYEKSIDDNTYNQIKIVKNNEKSGKRDVYVTKDSGSIYKFGLLQYFEVLDKNTNEAQAKSKADSLLKFYNREQETLSMKCLGDTSVRSGNSFYANISDIKLNKRLIVKSVAHDYLPLHTMDLEVML